MAFTDKNLVITPSVGSSGEDPKIVFSGADSSLGPQSLTARIYPSSNGTLSFEGSAGQLFSITNSLTGTIYSVNDASGLPSIEVFEDGVIRLARYSGRVVIGDAVDNGVDSIQFAGNTSFQFASLNANGTFTSTGQMVSLLADGTAPLVVQSTTLVANLNADFLDGQHGSFYTNASNLSTGTVPGDRGVTAGSTSSSFVEYNGTTATAGQFDGGTTTPTGTARLNYGGYFYPTALSLVGTGDTSTAATHYFVETGTDGFVRPKTLANTQAEIVTAATVNAVAQIASSSTSSVVRYTGQTSTVGAFDGGTTNPSGSNRLNYSGHFHATAINLTSTADTATAASHYFVETSSDGIIRPKTLANAQAEIVTAASANAIAVVAGSTTQSFVRYGGTTKVAGQWDGGSTAPTNTTRLNYDGYLYATRFYGDGSQLTSLTAGNLSSGTVPGDRGVTAGSASSSFVEYNGTTATAGQFDGGTTTPTGTTRLNYGGYLYATRYYTSNIYDLTGTTGTPTIYPDVTTGSVTIAAGLTTGTLNLGASAVGAKTVNIGTSTGTTIVYGSTVRLPNAGTPGAGKFLQSDASGNATWQTVVSGATISNDTTTNADTFYPGMTNNATSGAWTAATVSSTKLYFNPSTGQLNATNFNSLSDATKKENIKTIESATEKTLALRGVTFDWIDTKKGSLGVIAQEVEQIVPDAVSTSSSGEKSVNYGSLVGLLIETIKEQNARIEKLESIIAAK